MIHACKRIILVHMHILHRPNVWKKKIKTRTLKKKKTATKNSQNLRKLQTMVLII